MHQKFPPEGLSVKAWSMQEKSDTHQLTTSVIHISLYSLRNLPSALKHLEGDQQARKVFPHTNPTSHPDPCSHY